MSINGASSLPTESIQYDSSTKQPLPELTFPIDDFSSEKKKRDSSFYQSLVIKISQPVGSMSISPSSRDIVLATRKGLCIIDLENPHQPPREFNHLTKWEVADVQWNPHQFRDTWVASTSNQKALVWNLASPNVFETSLHAHNRAISDINWHPLHPNELATCSIEPYIHLWDIQHKKPVKSFCVWTAGATQVKFNKKNEFILASAHDKDLYIWDTRKGSLPITKISAHTTKIYGIDWSRTNANDIITCSLDHTVKFWNIQDPDTCQGVIHTNSPVWRARHTPFGNGILTMPQRSDKNLYLWNKGNLQNHVHTFEGHNDVVKEFVWRTKSEGDSTIDNREFQLITWSKDKTLRFWPIDDKLLKTIGHERGSPIRPTDQFGSTGQSTFTFRDAPINNRSSLRIIAGNRTNTNSALRPSGASAGGGNIKSYMGAVFRAERRSLSPLLWFQNVKMVKPSGEIGDTEDIHEEWISVAKKFPNVKIEKLDSHNRSCTISLRGPWSDSGLAFIRINITFPSQYPDKVAPIFDIQKTGMISILYRTRMLQYLKSIARTHVLQKRPCLEACIRYLLGEHSQEDGQERYGKEDSDDENYKSAKRRSSYDKNLYYILGDKEDYNVPFPKLCGSKFCATGKLVCFFSSLRSPNANNSGDSRNNKKTSYTFIHPRSYDSWEEYRTVSRLPRSITRYGDDESCYEIDEESNILLPFHPYLKNESQYNKNSSSSLALTDLDETVYAIHTYDFSEWMPISQKLAKEYILHGDDPVEICKYNAKVAACNSRPDLERTWLLASLILGLTFPTKFKNSLINDENFPTGKYTNRRRESGNGYDSFINEAFHGYFRKLNWGFHPFGRRLVKDLINHFSSVGDIQTAAMLSCVFQQPFPPHRRNDNKPKEFQLLTSELVAGNISSSTDYFNFFTRHPERLNPHQHTSFSGTFGSFNSSKSSFTDMFANGYINGTTPPTPSVYAYGQSEGAGIMVPEGHNPHHQRRSTFGGISKESSFFPSSIGTTASSPKTPKKGSPATGAFNNKLDGWVGNHGNEKLIERSDKRSILISCNLEELDDERRPVRTNLLDDKIETNVRYDQFRLAYAELLYHWGLTEARAEILKFMKFVKTSVGSPLGERREPLEIDIHCFQCRSELKGNRLCGFCRCKRVGIKCSICSRTVRGLSNFCMVCSHGGHTKHIREWFEENNECPSGCGCQCMINNGGF